MYATFAIFDKIASGLVIFFITNAGPFKAESGEFMKIMMVCVPGATAIAGFLASLFSSIKSFDQQEEMKVGNKELKTEFGPML